MPANFLYYKFIQLALPKAKFIHTFRNSWDNAISLFKANFQDTIIYASSFFGIANEYSNYSALMRFWKRNSANQSFLDIDYEKMVTNIGCAKRAQKFLEVRALLVVTRGLCC